MRICGNCEHNDGVVYTSFPPMIKCTITQEFHRNDHACELEFVPVVRCKDCRSYNTTGCQTGFGWCEHPIVSKGVYDDWFCASGEKYDGMDS